MNNILNLENVEESIDKLADEYHLVSATNSRYSFSSNYYLLDGDLEDLFYHSNIEIGKTLYKAKDWKYDEDGLWIINCEDGDYLETIELIQDGKTYICQACSLKCGDGLDYMLALSNVSKSEKNVDKVIYIEDDDCYIDIDMDFIKEEIENSVHDKLGNLYDCGISEELYDFLQDKKEVICKSVYDILNNNDYVSHSEFYSRRAINGFTEDLILDWEDIIKLEGMERERRIQSDILYNYDALWMTAIHKAFPNNTTNTQCGYGEMELIV